MVEKKKKVPRGPSRAAIGSNVSVSIALGFVLVGLINYISYRHYKTFDFSATGNFTLSDKTKNLLRSLESPIRILMLFGGDSTGYTEVKGLLERYRDEGAGRVRLEKVEHAMRFWGYSGADGGPHDR